MTTNTKTPIWHGVILVAGGAVGAGMFALPVVSAGAWTFWSVLALLLVWILTFLAAGTLLSSNLSVGQELGYSFEKQIRRPPASFNTLVRQRLGATWALMNNISLLFIMMILMYAYTSAGASIIATSTQQLSGSSEYLEPRWLSVLFAATVALVIWIGTSAVARISSVLMLAMALSFIGVAFELVPHIQIEYLKENTFDGLEFVGAAVPVFVTAFACAGLVPSLVGHYQGNRRAVQLCLFWGTLIALLVYLAWLALTFGVLGRIGFIDVIAAGGNTGELVSALNDVTTSSAEIVSSESSAYRVVSTRLAWFSHCAIITSFLSIGLGLFHFVQDKMRWSNKFWQRGKAVLCCFLPPTVASFYFPKGFVLAIGYAGLFVAFSFFVVPAMMVLFARPQSQSRDKRLAILALIVGLGVGLLKLLSVLSVLPVWP